MFVYRLGTIQCPCVYTFTGEGILVTIQEWIVAYSSSLACITFLSRLIIKMVFGTVIFKVKFVI